MPTLANLSGASCPNTDGLSFHPTLLGQSEQPTHTHLYWEYAGQTAVRMQNWKAYNGRSAEWELYDLAVDIEESHNLANTRPEVLSELIAISRNCHEPSVPGVVYDQNLVQKDREQAPHPKRKTNRQPN